MTEAEAQAIIADRHGMVVVDSLRTFLEYVERENTKQNLIAASTLAFAWTRHILDSVQLDRFAPDDGLWIDVGSGGGFPGLPIAIVRSGPVLLVEPRRRRAEFLTHVVDELGLADRVEVIQNRMERIEHPGRVISARAVAGIDQLFGMAHHCTRPGTRWILPRGHIASEEIDSLQQRWTFAFHVEQSLVVSGSEIAIFDGVRKR